MQATVYAVNDKQQYSYKHIKTNTMADTYSIKIGCNAEHDSPEADGCHLTKMQ